MQASGDFDIGIFCGQHVDLEEALRTAEDQARPWMRDHSAEGWQLVTATGQTIYIEATGKFVHTLTIGIQLPKGV
jgi:hypothetical protein